MSDIEPARQFCIAIPRSIWSPEAPHGQEPSQSLLTLPGAERRFEAGAGVMADDVVAGVYGAVALVIPAYLALLGSAAS